MEAKSIKKVKKIIITIIILIMVVVVSMFTFLYFTLLYSADIDGKHKGYSRGFNYSGRYSGIMYAVQSDKIEFNIDDVSLDLYCGWFEDLSNWKFDETTEQIKSVAFYIMPSEIEWLIDPQEDYRNVENQYFLAEISAKDFWSENFIASQNKSKGKIFNHSGKSIIIPKEAFSKQVGILKLRVQVISVSKSDELFYFDVNLSHPYSISIQYKYINDKTIILK